jgi:RNA-directed DNA polymerase
MSSDPFSQCCCLSSGDHLLLFAFASPASYGLKSKPEALTEMREIMQRLKLTVNEAKTRVCQLPKERFDFLGYAFGRCYSVKTGRAYLGKQPSKKSLSCIIEAIHGYTDRRTTWQETDDFVARINWTLTGWPNYFSLGPVSKAYNTIDQYTTCCDLVE